jgi:hypothetical protein
MGHVGRIIDRVGRQTHRAYMVVRSHNTRLAMDIYNAWFDLKAGVSDMEFCDRLKTYMDRLKSDGLMQGWRLTRRKLGLSAAAIGEFHLMMEFSGLTQLDQAFNQVGSRREPTEGVHFGVNSLVQNVQFALYRDFPDAVRHRGDEKF